MNLHSVRHEIGQEGSNVPVTEVGHLIFIIPEWQMNFRVEGISMNLRDIDHK